MSFEYVTKHKSKDWVLEMPTMVNQGFKLVDIDGANYWIKDD